MKFAATGPAAGTDKPATKIMLCSAHTARRWRWNLDKVQLQNTGYNDQGAFDAGNHYSAAPADGT